MNYRLTQAWGGRVLSCPPERRPSMRITDCHVHVQPWWEMRPQALELITRGRPDVEELQRIMKSPTHLLRLMDREGIERAVLVNYPSPDLMGFTERVNEYVAEYCQDAPERLLILARLGMSTEQRPTAATMSLLAPARFSQAA